MPTFDSVQVTGSCTVQGALLVGGNQTVQNDLQVDGNQTIAQGLQVNGSQTILNHLDVEGSAAIGGTVSVFSRLIIDALPSAPGIASSPTAVNYYSSGSAAQPGLVLPGSDGSVYVLFVDVSGAVPALGIQRL
ncbi:MULTISPECIES: hypothetical protein [Paenibacillus]|uniref:hypothetical protein n=1 Tax=Paenibacillus TaxID=44249 RepID=UPI0003903B55|nr:MULTISPECIES: hypothetical protein [Paenibacillus]KKC46687.1 hypothetical protein VE23_05430 [Paenibacillus sp. D9]CDN43542.1 Putative uncharacterized protein [Paenibacillus sp. P22]